MQRTHCILGVWQEEKKERLVTFSSEDALLSWGSNLEETQSCQWSLPDQWAKGKHLLAQFWLKGTVFITLTRSQGQNKLMYSLRWNRNIPISLSLGISEVTSFSAWLENGVPVLWSRNEDIILSTVFEKTERGEEVGYEVERGKGGKGGKGERGW